MLPGTFVGLLLLLWLVTPGFVFNALAARHVAPGSESAFQEVARTTASSIVFSAAGAAVAGLIVAVTPLTLDVGEIISDGRAYLADHYVAAGFFLSVQLITACGLAYGADALRRWQRRRKTGQPDPKLKTESAWTRVLTAVHDAEILVWIRLGSGVEIRGTLAGFGRDIDVATRELVLEPPLRIRYPQQSETELDWRYLTVQGSDVELLAAEFVQQNTRSGTP